MSDWRASAACKGVDTGVFFPPEGRGKTAIYERARRICARCPVTAHCLEDWEGLRRVYQNEAYIGMWAGLAPDERRKARRRLARERRAS